MRYLGLDLGTKTLGLAISDKTNTIASSLTTINFNSEDYQSLIPTIKKYLEEYNITTMVLGYPKNMNNSIGFGAQRSLDFKELLVTNFKEEVVLQDERLSSLAANNMLLQADLSRKKRKEVVDKVAASIILQNYLDTKKKEGN